MNKTLAVVMLPLFVGGCSTLTTIEIKGSVCSATDGSPLQGVSVFVDSKHVDGTTRTDDDGEFLISIDIADIHAAVTDQSYWKLRFTKDSFRTESVKIDLTDVEQDEGKIRRYVLLVQLASDRRSGNPKGGAAHKQIGN